jgi:hypothetical protein
MSKLKFGGSLKSDGVTYANLGSCSDEELMVHVRQGIGDALAVLFKRYQRLVFSVSERHPSAKSCECGGCRIL